MQVKRDSKGSDTLKTAIAGLDGSKSEVGWFPSARYPSGAPVAGIAYIHEHGSSVNKIPPRPFFRPTVAEKQQEWSATAAKIAKAVMAGALDPKAVPEAVALAAEGHVRRYISRLTTPPLNPKTVAARKARLANGGKGAQASIAKPLVDTGLLLATLTSSVNGDKG